MTPHWPCETEPARDLFTFLSDVKVSKALRMGVGSRLKKHGLLLTNDFKEAVWGPELECDHDTDEFGYMADLCNGLW
jgi:hypothetical protein